MSDAKEVPLTPEKALFLYKNEISTYSIYMCLGTVFYFFVSIGMTLVFQYFCDFLIMEQSPDTLVMAHFFVTLLTSASIGFIVLHYFTKFRLKDKGEKVENFRKWQKKEFEEKTKLSCIINKEDKIKIINDYSTLAKEKLNLISPIIKPAVIIALLAPPYSSFLGLAKSIEELGFAVATVLIVLALLLPLYWFGVSIFKFINNEQEIYSEYISILNEILYKIKYKVKKGQEIR